MKARVPKPQQLAMPENYKTHYPCDPELNTECSKTNCSIVNGGQCSHTSNIMYAKKPITTVNLMIPMTDEEAAELTPAEVADE